MLASRVRSLMIIVWAVALVVMGFFGRLARTALEWVLSFIIVAALVLGGIKLIYAVFAWLAG